MKFILLLTNSISAAETIMADTSGVIDICNCACTNEFNETNAGLLCLAVKTLAAPGITYCSLGERERKIFIGAINNQKFQNAAIRLIQHIVSGGDDLASQCIKWLIKAERLGTIPSTAEYKLLRNIEILVGNLGIAYEKALVEAAKGKFQFSAQPYDDINGYRGILNFVVERVLRCYVNDNEEGRELINTFKMIISRKYLNNEYWIAYPTNSLTRMAGLAAKSMMLRIYNVLRLLNRIMAAGRNQDGKKVVSDLFNNLIVEIENMCMDTAS